MFDRTLSIGVIFDIKKEIILPEIKKQLILFASDLGLNSKIFTDALSKNQGQSVGCIDNYKSDDTLKVKFEKVLAGLDVTDRDDEKYVLLLTDNYEQNYIYEKFPLVNSKKNTGYKFLYIGIGDSYDVEKFKSIENCQTMCLESVDGLFEELKRHYG